jgi:hypothetical protein
MCFGAALVGIVTILRKRQVIVATGLFPGTVAGARRAGNSDTLPKKARLAVRWPGW